MVLIDLDRIEVREVADHGVIPLPERPGNYIPELVTGQIEGGGIKWWVTAYDPAERYAAGDWSPPQPSLR